MGERSRQIEPRQYSKRTALACAVLIGATITPASTVLGEQSAHNTVPNTTQELFTDNYLAIKSLADTAATLRDTLPLNAQKSVNKDMEPMDVIKGTLGATGIPYEVDLTPAGKLGGQIRKVVIKIDSETSGFRPTIISVEQPSGEPAASNTDTRLDSAQGSETAALSIEAKGINRLWFNVDGAATFDPSRSSYGPSDILSTRTVSGQATVAGSVSDITLCSDTFKDSQFEAIYTNAVGAIHAIQNGVPHSIMMPNAAHTSNMTEGLFCPPSY